jgi:glycosyltransferase involved in cell wall biosynthesis
VGSSPFKIMLACNFARDERLGTSRTPLRLADELTRAGFGVSLLFSADLPRVKNSHLDLLSAPIRMARALATRAADADVVDIAGFDGWAYAQFARRRRPEQAIVSRSNGLWYRALAADGEIERRALRSFMSGLFQQQVLCRWERESMRSADVALFLSRRDGDEIVQRGWKTADGVAAVNPGVDDFFASPVALADRQNIASVGAFSYRKGNDVLARAMSDVLIERPNVSLTLFGTGMQPEDVLPWFDEAIRPRVRVVPPLSSAELAQQLAGFAIFVFPTRYEGFGLVVLEAMRGGLAVVTTATGAGADIVRHGENGLLVPFDDAAATAAAVRALIDDGPLRIRLATTAVEQARQRTWTRTATELVAVYEHARALARGRARAS